MQTQAAEIDGTISQKIALAGLCSVFAALALVIASVALYGTVAYNVARRTSEIGIRAALGAQPCRVRPQPQCHHCGGKDPGRKDGHAATDAVAKRLIA